MLFETDKYGDNIAIISDEGIKLSYSELSQDCNDLYTHIGKRCLIFCICDNRVGCVVGYISFLNYGIVPIMLSSHLDEELIDHLIQIYTPDYIWMPEDSRYNPNNYKTIYSYYGYELRAVHNNHSCLLNDELALLLSTSGSTGSPKLVRQSYRNIYANTISIIEYLKIDGNARSITTLPLNYTYGLSVVNTHIFAGATLLLTDKGVLQREFWDFFRDNNATSISGVPYTYEMLDKLRFYNMELPSLQTMTQAGGKLTLELQDKFARYAKERRIEFFVMYGQCEATARMGYLPPEMAEKKIGSIGIPIPGGHFYLKDENGDEITQPHIVGELVYEGENVTLGYAEKKEDLAKGDELEGVLKTGDMAEFDEDGYYYIVGRKKRFLKIYGNRINLDELDLMLKEKFGIEVVCTGRDDHLYIFVTSEEYTESMKIYLAEKTRLNPSAFNVRIIDAIPKNDAGKTLYKELDIYI